MNISSHLNCALGLSEVSCLGVGVSQVIRGYRARISERWYVAFIHQQWFLCAPFRQLGGYDTPRRCEGKLFFHTIFGLFITPGGASSFSITCVPHLESSIPNVHYCITATWSSETNTFLSENRLPNSYKSCSSLLSTRTIIYIVKSRNKS